MPRVRKTKQQRRHVGLQIILAIEQFEMLLENNELEELSERANPLELAFLENLGDNLDKLNEMIVARRRDRATS